MKVYDGAAGERDDRLEPLVAALASAAYRIALRHGALAVWVDLELDLWRALMEVVKKWDSAEPIERPEHSDGAVVRRRPPEDEPAHVVDPRELSADYFHLVVGGPAAAGSDGHGRHGCSDDAC